MKDKASIEAYISGVSVDTGPQGGTLTASRVELCATSGEIENLVQMFVEHNGKFHITFLPILNTVDDESVYSLILSKEEPIMVPIDDRLVPMSEITGK
jgi:hypothetical protein